MPPPEGPRVPPGVCATVAAHHPDGMMRAAPVSRRVVPTMSERVNPGSGPSPLRDARTAIVVANELRHALISAIFGGSRREANFVTALAAGVALGGVASLFGRLGRLRIHHPSLGGAVLGSAIARESAHTV